MSEGFHKMHLDEEGVKTDSFTVRLNPKERQQLEADKAIIEQPKDSTAIKQLASIGSKVIHDDLQAEILAVLFKNKRNNKRQGIVDFE